MSCRRLQCLRTRVCKLRQHGQLQTGRLAAYVVNKLLSKKPQAGSFHHLLDSTLLLMQLTASLADCLALSISAHISQLWFSTLSKIGKTRNFCYSANAILPMMTKTATSFHWQLLTSSDCCKDWLLISWKKAISWLYSVQLRIHAFKLAHQPVNLAWPVYVL